MSNTEKPKIRFLTNEEITDDILLAAIKRFNLPETVVNVIAEAARRGLIKNKEVSK